MTSSGSNQPASLETSHWQTLSQQEYPAQLLKKYQEFELDIYPEALTPQNTGTFEDYLAFADLMVIATFALAKNKNTYLAFHVLEDQASESPITESENDQTAETPANFAKDLKNIYAASLVSADATKAVQSLLDHISYDRMAEEGDTRSYLNSLSRRYKSASDKLQTMSGTLEEVAKFKQLLGDMENWFECFPNIRVIINKNTNQKNQLEQQKLMLDDAKQFLEKTLSFCIRSIQQINMFQTAISAQNRIESVKRILYSIFEESTNIGLFSNFIWKYGTLALALTLVLILVFGNNIAVKEYVIALTTLSAAVAYYASYKINKKHKIRTINSIRSHIKTNIFNCFKNESYFKSNKNSIFLKPYAKIKYMYNDLKLNSYSSEFRFRKFPFNVEYINSFTETSDLQYKYNKSRIGWFVFLLITNIVLFSIIIAFFFAFSFPRLTLPFLAAPLETVKAYVPLPKWRHHAFISQDANGDRCLLQHGRVLYASSSAYYLMASNNDGIAKVLKSKVLSVENSDVMKKYQLAGKLPDCLGVRKTDAVPSLTDAALHQAAEAVSKGQIAINQSLATISQEIFRLSHPQKCNGTCTHTPASQSSTVVVPVVVEPAAISTTSASPQIVTQAPRFFTTIISDGTAQSMKSILLPLFSRPVENGIVKPVQAYEFGKERNLIDPVVTDGNRSFVDSIAYALKVCSDATNKAYEAESKQRGMQLVPNPIELTVSGYATATALPPELNHHLAEGRRMAIIRKLKSFLGDRIKITREPPAEYLLTLDNPANPGVIPTEYMQFKNYRHMEQSLQTWLKQAPGGAREELLGRSATIEFDNDALRQCGGLAIDHGKVAGNQ